MPQPRILQITACTFPPEIRVLKEVRTLRDAGFETAVLCPPIKGRPARESWNGIEIFRPETLAAAASTVDKLLYQASYFSPAWRRAVREVIAAYQPAVLHVHDIWLARSVFAASTGQKLVMDLHENMPAAVTEYLKGYRGAQKAFNFLFKPRARVLRYERAVLQKSDRTLVVVAEAGARVVQEHPQLPGDKLVVVENLESKDFLAAAAPEPAIRESVATVLYIGGFGPHRGIDTLIAAMQQLKAWSVPVRLDLIGATAGSTYVRMLREQVAALDVASHVNMVEWVPAEKVLSYIRTATIGAVPHHSNPHTDNTIPHKLYQYMIAGTPVLVSTSAPLARTVRAAGAGEVFRAGDAAHCAHVIRDMLRDRDRLRQYGAGGRGYVLEQGHNWEDEAAPRLVRMYQALLNGAA
jgi:glycosyltransferase involved in cell wall biosynthesis